MNRLSCPSVDTNFLNSNDFSLSIERLPGVSFFSSEVELPGVTLNSLDEPTPLSDIKIPGDRLSFDTLSVTFYVDANMANYIEAFKWMQGLGFPRNHEQYTRENNTRPSYLSELEKNYSDASLMVINAGKTFKFIDCFPTRLSGIRFETQAQDVTYAVATLDLDYSYFIIVDTVDSSVV
jgi:hypothetical protein